MRLAKVLRSVRDARRVRRRRPWSSLSRSQRRRFRTVAVGVASAATLITLTVVVVVSAVSERAGTFVSPTTCTNTTASNLKFDPATGAEGTSVYITAANFADVTDVTFNGTPVTSYNVISATEITTAVPAGATNGPIAIVSGTTPVTSDTCFTTTSPAIASFGPVSGAAGTTLTITGANLAGANLAAAWFERDQARYGLLEMHRERDEARDENERLRSECQAAVEVAVAADEYWDVAECDCCGGLPFCDYRTEHREVNKVGQRLTEAITRFKATKENT